MTKKSPKYPDVTVKLSGEDGNAFSIISRVSRGMKRAGISERKIAKFREKALAESYDNLLQIAMRTVNIE